MENRKTWDNRTNPMSIYEVHMGSWMRHPGTEDEGFYTYREFAEAITKYVKDMVIRMLSLWVLQSIRLTDPGDIR